MPRGALRVSILVLLLLSPDARAYRPFDSTDADVTDAKELEIELGYFTMERTDGENSFVVPQFVLNYGLSSHLELVAEFELEKPQGSSGEVTDAAILLKRLVNEGVLQDQPGRSFAIEAGVLLPSTSEQQYGAEAIGVLSGQLSSFLYHLNFGGGLDRTDSRAFAVWGAILELPVRANLRVVGEINGESVRGEAAENSALLGVIWESPASGHSFDAGVRWGLSSAAPDWALTLGWTFSFAGK